jgi:hypothetical protein
MNTTALATIPEEKKKNSNVSQVSKPSLWRDNLVSIIAVALVSVGLYNYGQVGYKLNSRAASKAPHTHAHDQPVSKPVSAPIEATTLDALQIIYEEVHMIRRELAELKEQMAHEAEARIMRTPVEVETEVPPEVFEPPAKIHFKDFKQMFSMLPSNDMEIDSHVSQYFSNYTLENDPIYQENKEHLDMVVSNYADAVPSSQENESRFFVSWNPDKQDYSLFASANLPKNTFLGSFAGVITDHTMDPTKTWRYKANLKDESGEPVELVIDGRNKGNYFYFLQVAYEHAGNVEAFFIPKDNLWYIGFRTTRPIMKDEEIVLNNEEIQ